MFLGESLHSLDSKFRIVVPRRFLAEFSEDDSGKRSAVLTRGFEGCLFLFPEAGFKRALERMQLQAFGGQELRNMQRMFFSNAHSAQIDSAGRLVVPEKHRKLARLERDVVLVGVADRAEIWSKEVWEAFSEEHDEQFDRLDTVLLGGQDQPQPKEG